MFTKDELEQLGELLKPIKKQLDTVEMEVEAVHEFNKKAHAEIMDKLVTSNEINGQELKKLDERVEIIEKAIHKN